MKILIIILLMCLTGCRSMKTANKAREEMKRNTQLNSAAVKAGTRETNTVTYWPDGHVYQFQNVKEQMDQTKLGRLDMEEKRVAAQSEVEKTGPWKVWLYVGIGLGFIAGMCIYRIIK